MSTEIFEYKLIDHLVALRGQLIAKYLDSIALQKEALKISNDIDQFVPSHNAGYYDDFSTVFINLASAIGENAKGRSLPRMSNVVQMSDKQISETVTKVIDRDLWVMLFNRLGLFAHMSNKQSKQFRDDCKKNPMPFEREIIITTLDSMYSQRRTLSLEALFDSLQSLSNNYVCNEKKMFTKKFIVKNALSYNGKYNLVSHDALQNIVSFIWNWVLMNRWYIDENGYNQGEIWETLKIAVKEADDDISSIKSISCLGVHFSFHKNLNCHVELPPSMADAMNEELSKTKALFSE